MTETEKAVRDKFIEWARCGRFSDAELEYRNSGVNLWFCNPKAHEFWECWKAAHKSFGEGTMNLEHYEPNMSFASIRERSKLSHHPHRNIHSITQDEKDIVELIRLLDAAIDGLGEVYNLYLELPITSLQRLQSQGHMAVLRDTLAKVFSVPEEQVQNAYEAGRKLAI